MEGALDWLRESNISTGDLDDATVALFRSLGPKIDSRTSSPEDKDRRFGDVSDWLRNRSRDPKGLDDGKLETSAKLRDSHANARVQAFRKERALTVKT
jgi:hypothetical protein